MTNSKINYNAIAPIINVEGGAHPHAMNEEVNLSADQSMLKLISDMSKEGSLAYNNAISLNLEGDLNEESLKLAINQVVERHSALRTTISEDGEKQIICQELNYDYEYQDFSNLDEKNTGKELDKFLEKESKRCFDLRKSLFRCYLIKLSEKKHIFGMVIHHIICDGVSVGIILEEISFIYTEICQGREALLPKIFQYKDYLAWVLQKKNSEEILSQISFWKEVAKKDIPSLNLPTDYMRPEIKTYAGARLSSNISKELCGFLKEMSKKFHLTYFMVLEAAYNLLLHYASKQKILSVGIAFSGRRYPESENVVGYCSNIYPIVSILRKGMTFRTYLQDLKLTLLDAYENQDCRFSDIIEASNVIRDKSHSFFFSVAFNWDRIFIPEFYNLQVSYKEQPISGTEYDLMPNIMEVNDELVISWDYNTDLFKRETIENFSGKFVELLKYVLSNPDQPLEVFEDKYFENISNKTIFESSKEKGVSIQSNTLLSIEEVKSIIKEVLSDYVQCKNLKEDDDFFYMGLNSLDLARAFPKLKKKLGLDTISIVDIFKHSSITKFSNFIKTKEK